MHGNLEYIEHRYHWVDTMSFTQLLYFRSLNFGAYSVTLLRKTLEACRQFILIRLQQLHFYTDRLTVDQ